MNYPAAPMSGIYASLRQATGYQSEVILTPQEAGNLPASGGSNLYPPQEGLSASGGLVRLRRIELTYWWFKPVQFSHMTRYSRVKFGDMTKFLAMKGGSRLTILELTY